MTDAKGLSWLSIMRLGLVQAALGSIVVGCITAFRFRVPSGVMARMAGAVAPAGSSQGWCCWRWPGRGRR